MPNLFYNTHLYAILSSMAAEYFVEDSFQFEFETKKSRFISILTPFNHIDQLKKIIHTLKQEHKKANHIVYAYRFYKNGILYEKFTDDKEPRNTAGNPTLNAMAKNNIVNCSVFTIRYFGGILLGRGGLIRAYSSSALGVIKKAELKTFHNAENLCFDIEYSNLKSFEYLSKKHGFKIGKKEFLSSFVKITIYADRKDAENVFSKFVRL